MASEHDILSRLPEAPIPSPDARQAAIAEALGRFETRNRTLPQGSPHDLRLMQQTASSTPPSRRRSIMVREHHAIAAVFVIGVIGSVIGLYAHKTDEFQIASRTPT